MLMLEQYIRDAWCVMRDAWCVVPWSHGPVVPSSRSPRSEIGDRRSEIGGRSHLPPAIFDLLSPSVVPCGSPAAAALARSGAPWWSGGPVVPWSRSPWSLLSSLFPLPSSLFLLAIFFLLPSPASAASQTLLSFGSASAQGRRPYSGVVVGKDSALYGTTIQGGTNGVGTLFKVNADGTGYTLFHTFLTNGIDGQSPVALLQGSDGKLYGTTSIGGTNRSGTIYGLNTNGTGYTLLHTFGSIAGDGQNPQAGLMEGTNGTLYGTTFFGGAQDGGIVFKLNKDGSGYQVIHVFTAWPTDGDGPSGALVEADDGYLYGTTVYGGQTAAIGTLFRLRKNGSDYSLLHTFQGKDGDGSVPTHALCKTANGDLFGITQSGGEAGVGTVFGVFPKAIGREPVP